MPIGGLSDRESVDPRFQEIGRIRKGAPKTGNQPGKDLSYFRYVPAVRHEKSAEIFRKIYGDKPTELTVHFPFGQMERVFSSWREAYGQNKMCQLRCDGARWHDWIDGDRHHHSEAGRECELRYRDSENKCPECPCQYSGRLSVFLQPMWEKGQIGLVTVITSSINDIAHLAAKLVQWEPLTGRPFTLWRQTTRIGVPIQGERKAKDSDLLRLELSEEQMVLEFQESKRMALERFAGAGGIPLQVEAKIESTETVEEAKFTEAEPETEPTPPPHRASGKPKRRSFKVDVLDAVIAKGYADDRPAAMAALNLSELLTREDSPNRAVDWAASFAAQLKQNVEVEAAALVADKMLRERE